jgi:hypothetical protein
MTKSGDGNMVGDSPAKAEFFFLSTHQGLRVITDEHEHTNHPLFWEPYFSRVFSDTTPWSSRIRLKSLKFLCVP